MCHPAITRDVLLQLQRLQQSGLTHWASIETLRLQTVPSGYTPHAWNRCNICCVYCETMLVSFLRCLEVPDISTETRKDCLRSIIAQFMYQHQVSELEKEGKNFRVYAYIPESDAATGLPFHEREDHNHVLKVLQQSYCFCNE